MSLETKQIAGERFAIVGAGGRARKIAREIAMAGGTVSCFLETEPSRESLDGIRIFKTAEWMAGDGPANDVGILGIHNTSYAPRPHWGELRKVFKRHVDPISLSRVLNLDDGYWMGFGGLAEKGKPFSERMRGILGDTESLGIFEQTMLAREREDVCLLPDGEPLSLQYVPKGISMPEAGYGFIDGGACLGEAVENLSNAGHVPGRAYLFEPDMENFNSLATRRWPCETILFNRALWDSEALLSFGGGVGGSGSAVIGVDGGCGFDVRAMALDDLTCTAPAKYVKLDVEGAEMRALLGADTFIRTHRPLLAVAIYHRPEDLWEIPIFLHDRYSGMGGAVRLRQHGWLGFDLFAYVEFGG